LIGLFPGGGGQGLVGVPIFGGSAGGTSSLLTDVSSSTLFLMTTLLTELDVAELKGSSLLTFDNVLKSANPSSNDSLPKTEAKGSVAESLAATTVPPGAKGSLCFNVSTDVLLLLLAALKGSVLEVAKGSAEDCLKKQSDANGSEPLKGSPPNGSIFPKGSSLKGSPVIK